MSKRKDMTAISSAPHHKADTRQFEVNLKHFARWQFAIVTTLVLLGLLTYIFAYAFNINTTDYTSVHNFLAVFDLGKEQSAPTWFSSLNLLFSSFLLYCVYAQGKANKKPKNRYWLCLSFLFLFLSIDEIVGLHNMPAFFTWYIVNRPDLFPQFVPLLFDTLGFDHPMFTGHSWLIYAILVVPVVGALFIPFLWSIEPRLAFLMILSGFLFLSGAIGLESISAWMVHIDYGEKGTIPRNLLTVGEEALEMYSIAFFNCVLFSELVNGMFRFRVLFGHDLTLAREGHAEGPAPSQQ